MKKTIALILALMMVLSLAACGGEKGTADKAGSDQAQPQSDNSQEKEDSAPGQEKAEVPAELIGTWTLAEGTCSDENGHTFSEFTVDSEGNFTAGDITGTLEGREHGRFSVPDCGISILMDSGSPNGVFQTDGLQYSDGNYYGRFYRNLKRTELTLDNWSEFFEFSEEYIAEKDSFGDVKTIRRDCRLQAKENVVAISGGAIEVSGINTGYGRIHYNTKTEEFYLTDDYQDWELEYIEKRKNENQELTFQSSLATSYIDGKPTIGVSMNITMTGEPYIGRRSGESNDFGVIVEGDTATALIVTQADIDVLRIAGTVAYIGE